MDPIANSATNLPPTADAATNNANVAVVTVLVSMPSLCLTSPRLKPSMGLISRAGESSVLDMHKVGFMLIECKPTDSSYNQLESLVHANKVCKSEFIMI